MGLVVAGAIMLWMSRWTSIRIDAAALLIEQKPSGPFMTIASDRIKKFLIVDENRRIDPHSFPVYAMLVEGEPLRLSVEFPSDAEARFVAARLNEMLGHARGNVGRR
jgi:hypothetical protein